MKKARMLLCAMFLVAIFFVSAKAYPVNAAETADTSWYDNRTEGQTEFTISTEAQLRGLSKLVNESTTDTVENYFVGCTINLGADIVMDGDTPFSPIGNNKTRAFKGTFNGNNYTISNLTVINMASTVNNVGIFGGLFGSLVGESNSTAVVKNLNLKNVKVYEKEATDFTTTLTSRNQTNEGTGALVGYAIYASIENCTVDNATVENNLLSNTGGMIGWLSNGSISNCKVTNTTVSGIMYEALLVGRFATGNTLMKDIYVQGTVTDTAEGGTSTGAVAGISTPSTNIDIDNIKVDKNTSVSGNSYVGGIFGTNCSPLKNCVTYANVTGKKVVSGIARTYGKKASYTNCINYGNVTGEEYVSGITSAEKTPSGATTIPVKECYNLGNVTATKETDTVGALAYRGAALFAISDSYNLGSVKNASGNAAQFDTYNTYSKVAYNSENGVGVAEGSEGNTVQGLTGYTLSQFKDRTVVDALNQDQENVVWYQNVDYPDFAANMTKITDITISDSLSVTVNKTETLKASVTPEDATNSTLTYVSSDAKVATVSENGTVTGVSAGTADITVTAVDTGTVSKTVKVTVKEEDTSKKEETTTGKKEETTTGTKGNTATTIKKGAKVISGNNKYVVTDTKAKTVTYSGTTNKKATKVTIPASVKINNKSYKVTSIAAKAFKNNKKLKSVVIGKNIKKIGKQAFYGCKQLKKITVKSTVLKKVGAKAFKGIHKKAVIKVPSKKYKKYKKVLKGKGQAKTVKIKK